MRHAGQTYSDGASRSHGIAPCFPAGLRSLAPPSDAWTRRLENAARLRGESTQERLGIGISPAEAAHLAEAFGGGFRTTVVDVIYAFLYTFAIVSIVTHGGPRDADLRRQGEGIAVFEIPGELGGTRRPVPGDPAGAP